MNKTYEEVSTIPSYEPHISADPMIERHLGHSLHSINDEPALKIYTDSGLWGLDWYRFGDLHRDGEEPAMVRFTESSRVYSERWYKNGVEILGP